MAQDYSKILNNSVIISWAKTYLKKSDRIIWYLKVVRDNPKFHPSEDLKHFYSMNITAINEIPLTNQNPQELVSNFKKIEVEYHNSQKDSGLIPIKKGDKVVLTLPDNWYWVKTKTHSCDLEAKAMQHCGNESGEEGERILSLRQIVVKGGKKFWQPHATFILQPEGVIGEMKGKQNRKPHSKYHSQIVALLSSDIVNKIQGGGYNSKENFCELDLDDSLLLPFIQKYPHKVKPYFLDIIPHRQNKEFLYSYPMNNANEQECHEFVDLFFNKREDYVELIRRNPNGNIFCYASFFLRDEPVLFDLVMETKRLELVSYANRYFSRQDDKLEKLYRADFVQADLTTCLGVVQIMHLSKELVSKLAMEFVEKRDFDSEIFIKLIGIASSEFLKQLLIEVLPQVSGFEVVELKNKVIENTKDTMFLSWAIHSETQELAVRTSAAQMYRSNYSGFKDLFSTATLPDEVMEALIGNISEISKLPPLFSTLGIHYPENSMVKFAKAMNDNLEKRYPYLNLIKIKTLNKMVELVQKPQVGLVLEIFKEDLVKRKKTNYDILVEEFSFGESNLVLHFGQVMFSIPYGEKNKNSLMLFDPKYDIQSNFLKQYRELRLNA